MIPLYDDKVGMTPSSSQLHNPHDRFFRGAMSNPKIALAFINTYLPSFLVEKINPSSLHIADGTFIDPSLRQMMTDILYEVRFQEKPGYLYFLIEHQRQADSEMPLRLLEYTLRIFRTHSKKYGKGPLPLVYPCVLYNGEYPYSHSTDFFEMFEDSQLARKVFLQPFQLIDLTTIPDNDLQEHSLIGMMELLLKHASTRDVLVFLKKIFTHIKILDAQDELELLTQGLRYLLETHQEKETILNFFQETINSDNQSFIMTAAQQLIEEGIQLGRQEGRQEGFQEGYRTLLDKQIRRRFPSTVTAKHLHLIAQASSDQLALWLENLLDARNVEEVF